MLLFEHENGLQSYTKSLHRELFSVSSGGVSNKRPEKCSVHLKTFSRPVALKGTYYGKFTFTWCLDINVCWQCVSKTTLE